MRKLENDYGIIYVDLDNTLIYGFMTDLMDITWKMFKSQLLGELLMYIQAVFKLYKINRKLLYQIQRSNLPVVILTARKESYSTKMIINKLDFTIQDVGLNEMATYHPAIDKVEYILDNLKDNIKPVLFDDNKLTRQIALLNDIDAYDPTVYFEEKV